MKTLKDTILEKLKVDDIILNKERFPIDGTIDDMIEFLDDTGFKEVPSYGIWNQTFKNYKKCNGKCFAVDKSSPVSIEIIDRSNFKSKNKLFYIELNANDKYDYKYNIFDDITTAMSWDIREVSKEEFLKELSEIL